MEARSSIEATSTQPVVAIARVGRTSTKPPAAVSKVGTTLTRPVAAVARAGANNYVQPMLAVTPVGVTPTPPAGTPTGSRTGTSGQPVAAGTPHGATSGQPVAADTVAAVTVAGTTSIPPVAAVSQVGPTSGQPVVAVKLSETTSVPPVAAVSQDRPTSGQLVAAVTLAGTTAIPPLAAVSQDAPTLGHPVAAVTLAGTTPIQPGAVVTQAGATSTQLVSAELQVGTTSSEPAAATASSVGAAEVGDVIAVLGWCTFPGCSEDFASWAGYVEHCLQRHGRSLCPTCLNVHAAQHGDADAKCALCSARFVDSQALRVHKNFFHRAFDSITSRKWHLRIQEARAVIGWCTFPHCGRAFLSWEEHVVHQKESHLAPTQDDTVCDLCLAVKPVAGLPDHLEAHRLWDAPCSLCAARFIADNTDHRQQFHHATSDGEVPAVLGWCIDTGCESSFSRWQDHVQHFLLHHWTLDADLVCRVCLARFQSQDEAKEHLKDHASPGKQQFRCTSCPVGFLTLKHFRKHMSHFHGLWVSRFSP
ncbi:uncharacterized protein LOC117651757 [Thrips palmi]|uniref:Uncharacterized protein LOC117651757 n=1 Tax=Thrips palmi TaxID=161013 RepID=A0A6P9A414_THRPL|nr:uncharacterized protein LOC117651757 [Thrips palmi]